MKEILEHLASKAFGKQVRLGRSVFPNPSRHSVDGAEMVAVRADDWEFGAHRRALMHTRDGHPVIFVRG